MTTKRIAPKMQRASLLGALCITIVLVVIAYSNTFQSPPVLDDFHSFVRNQKIQVDQWSVGTVKDLSEGFFGPARWLPMLTFALDYNLGGGAFSQFHITNLIIHLLAFLAVFFLVFHCARAAGKDDNPFPLAHLALWTAAIWAFNPVQTSAVTYMVQRMASIQALFYVLTVGCYLWGRNRQLAAGRWMPATFAYAGCLLFALAAFLSKENSATLPVMIALAEVWFFQPSAPQRLRQWFRSAPKAVWVLTALLLITLTIAGCWYVTKMAASYGHRHFIMTERLLTQTRIVVWYMSLLLWPMPGRLSLEHDVVISASLFNPFTTFLSIILHAVFAWFIIKQRRRLPLITFGLLWFYVNLAIESSIVPLELVFEHRLYLPSVGFLMAVVFGVSMIFQSLAKQVTDQDKKRLAWSTAAILCSALTLLTFYRNEAWRDIVSINQDAVEKAPNHPRAHANLATALLRAERYDEAVAAAEKAIALGRPHLEDYCVAANDIIGVYTERGQWAEAVQRGEEFIRQRPPDSDAGALPNLHLRVAYSYRQLNQLDKAYQHTKEALIVLQQQQLAPHSLTYFAAEELRLILAGAQQEGLDLDGDGIADPGDLPAGTWIAKTLAECKAIPQALDLMQKTLQERPRDRATLALLTQLTQERESNRRQGERWSFEQKYVRKPVSLFNIYMAAAYWVRKNKLPEPLMRVGEFCLTKARELRPADPDVYLLQGWYRYEKGLYGEAAGQAEHAIQLDPDYAKAWLGLGFFLKEQGDRQGAAGAFEKTLDLYPGYPERAAIRSLIAALRQSDQSISSAGEENVPQNLNHSIAYSKDGAPG